MAGGVSAKSVFERAIYTLALSPSLSQGGSIVFIDVPYARGKARELKRRGKRCGVEK